MSMPLRIVLPFSLLFALLVGAVGWGAARRAQAVSEARIEGRLANAAGLLATLPGSFDQMRIDEIKLVLGLELATEDYDGERYHTLPLDADRDVRQLLRRARQPGPEARARPPEAELGGVRYRVRWARSDPSQDVLIALLVPLEQVRASREHAARGILAASAIALLLAVLVGALLARTLTRPLARLAADARAIQAGELEREVTVAGPPEVRDLGQAIRSMLGALGELRAARVEAAQQALLAQMATSIAHEIRNPLTSIKMMIELLAERPELAGQRADLDVARGEVARLESVVGELLVLGKPTELRRVGVDLREPIEASLRLFAARFAHRGVRLEAQLPETRVRAEADPDRLQQILTNLITNALEASAEGGLVTVSLALDSGLARIGVRDQGQGVAEPDQLFVPFRTTKRTGTGVGLAISRQIARAHGGELHHRPSETGAFFELELPASP